MNGPRRPRGLLRLGQRYPLVLYRLGLGVLLTKRYLRLTTIGRHSGRPRRCVLYSFRYDQATGEHFVAAVFGPRTDWYRNLMAAPGVEVVVGHRRFVPQHRVVPADEGAALIDAFRRERPRYAAMVERMRGHRFEGDDVPVIALRPSD